MVRVPLIVLLASLPLTATALIVAVVSGPTTPLVWTLWALWGITAIGGACVYLIARKRSRI
ncbi:hypothetical protein GCM10007147_13040 [Nocardiopsis kunsanensis]|uniref:Uncharacterized protein n=1 Tax=Nocardiopsis kunsanensis TaxID=141693 RepID=A0A919CH55_9ACTN|nr:hypothetical protein GCM10007147_13040 [Nocardiopsis kunsanensis]